MSRAGSLLFSTIAYAIFFATFLYLIAFVGNLPLAALTLDRGPDAPVAVAVIVDLALISLFGLQHSVMARQGFKKAWTRIVPHYLERSIYVLAASAALIVMFLVWRPIPQVIWDAGGTALEFPIWLLFASGWLVVLLSTFMINHFELFGLQQAWFHMRSREAQSPELRHPFFYRWVAHPLYAGFFISFWAIPKMTAGHLLFALGMSVYILIAIRYEERDLRGLFGRDYEDYRATVGMLTPKFFRRAA
jgi:protein-S-isoprenylcysteine O-methyltransferase Ste14